MKENCYPPAVPSMSAKDNDLKRAKFLCNLEAFCGVIAGLQDCTRKASDALTPQYALTNYAFKVIMTLEACAPDGEAWDGGAEA
jgi:hypothetical protein